MRKLAVGLVSVFLAGVFSQPAAALEAGGNLPRLESNAAIVIDQEQGAALYAKNARAVMPIASITKLMTAIVVLDARLPLDEPLEVTHDDLDFVKGTRSRLGTGTVLTRREMLKLALMASENRAASALGRHYPGGFPAFVSAMNRKARELGMRDTRFVDSTGLNPDNVSTAQDLVRLVEAGLRYQVIRDFTTSESHYVEVDEGRRSRVLSYNNSNGLVRARNWDIGLSKTGYISEAGRCLVMQAQIAAKPVIIVLLDSWGKMSRIADANRIRHWLEGETRVREPRTMRVRNQAAPRASKLGRSGRQDGRRVSTRRA